MLFFLTLLTIAFILGCISNISSNIRESKQISLKKLQDDNEKEHLRALKLDKKERAIKYDTEKLKSDLVKFEKEKSKFEDEKKKLIDAYYVKVDERVRELLPEYKKIVEEENKAFKFVVDKYSIFLSKATKRLLTGIEAGRLHNAFEYDDAFTLLELKAEIKSKSQTYRTSLSSCTCDDFRKKKIPACKHMLFWAYSLGILQLYRNKHQAYFDKFIEEAKKTKKDGKSNDKTKKSPSTQKANQQSTSPSLSNKSNNISPGLRGSEEDM